MNVIHREPRHARMTGLPAGRRHPTVADARNALACYVDVRVRIDTADSKLLFDSLWSREARLADFASRRGERATKHSF